MKSGVSFDPDKDIPDLSGKVILVTGGNTGLGLETVLQLAKHNPAHIYLAARSEEKGNRAIKEVQEKVPNAPPITFLRLDLGSLESTKAAAASFRASSDRLDILINNAGIMAVPEGLTKDGYEIQFGTNHLGHALLTKLLLPTLKATAATPSSDVRVVFLSSSAGSIAPKDSYHLDKAKTTMPDIGTWTRYGQSKLANIHYNAALAKRHPDIKFISLHPGVVKTNLGDSFINSYGALLGTVFRFIGNMTSISVEKGALNQLWAATSQDVESGVFYYPVGVTGKGSELSNNEKVREQLWEWTEKELESYVV
ncbi:uncharacterized protein NECHADRAFT_41149 [Fusarium vanettenii 77-13-4]|uniref:Short-chain dehydrogenase/reductase n=1 Tax=Fusarium vanettenii (strain ATCC MYA-4622 / CBS 123669 / FGSC 9596 / NRRL 45880 / 77-13-4) TaxID=660122 RepID=C7YSM2_FUSV7|nr:uncharacterized protein NECHADRAFT_41149 [Fusarium vanettenii 77-13-4]EEU45267.1 hypothetical protein NECHADRAFT_41149 [Fusarium vanettenii 77-13-4]